ncbi:MAG: esterase-like activity of phytase family protein [Hyphomonadaceae bacterium]|nr:esterase-like activity of phytase family protein [Hyphomonadaceae bacterium]
MRVALIGPGLLALALLAISPAFAQDGSDPIGNLIDERPPVMARKAGAPGDFSWYLSALRAKSCPPGSIAVEGDSVVLKTSPVALQPVNPARKSIGALTFVAGFHLTSPDARFGGLSGLDLLNDEHLLAVGDTGQFVWIDLASDGITPVAARIAALKNSAGRPLSQKGAADAEGLAVRDGLALVSFERDPRIVAYDIGACGAAARGAAVRSSLPGAFALQKLTVDENQGVEGLAVTDDWSLLSGIETKIGKASPLSARPLEARARFDLAIGDNAPELVGLDQLPAGDDVRVFSLHRSSRVLSGNAITIVETVLARRLDQSNLPARVISEIDERSRWQFSVKSSRVLAEMNLLVTIDNFEGIAARQMPDGRVRLFIVSDDNFSASQRTLLMVYDVK